MSVKAKKKIDLEVIPESDDFQIGKHPRHHLGLQGHHDTAQKIVSLFNQNKAPHGFLLTGHKGVGKATFVYHLIRALENFGNELTVEQIYNQSEDITYRKIQTLSHGNLKILRRQFNQKTGKFYQSIRMDDLREIKSFFEFKAHGNGKRYVIIDSFDDCIHGQNSVPNAILKTLEEPPDNCFFFILAHREGNILPTIRSRCSHFPMSGLEYQSMKQIIAGLPNARIDNIDKIIELSGGSVRHALVYADPLWYAFMGSIKKALYRSIPAQNALPIRKLKDRSFDGTMSVGEFLNIVSLICLRAISDNAKFAVSQGHHASVFASTKTFETIYDLFIQAEAYNFTPTEVIDRIVAILDYYHYLKSQLKS